MAEPLLCEWDGEVLRPALRHEKRANRELIVGERYMVEAVLPRNMAAHRAYFAGIREVWLSLPEDDAERFPNPEALRKHALIMTGYCTDTHYACADAETALRLAADLSHGDDYPLVQIAGNVVRVRRAKTQSVAGMGPADFRASKHAVEAFLAGMIGVEPADVALAGRAA